MSEQKTAVVVAMPERKPNEVVWDVSTPGGLSVKWTMEQVELVKRTIAKGCTNDELRLFLYVASKTGLDPFAKQIYPVKRRSKQGPDVMTIQTGIDGYRVIADRTGRYAPGRAPTFEYNEDGSILSATAYVKKYQGGQWHEVEATAFWSEYVQTTRDGHLTDFWKRMPHNQIAKCAETLALRKAFPADLSDLRTDEEMSQADSSVVVPSSIAEDIPQEPARLSLAQLDDEPEPVDPLTEKLTQSIEQEEAKADGALFGEEPEKPRGPVSKGRHK